MLLKLFIFLFLFCYISIYTIVLKFKPKQYVDNIALNKTQLDREILYKLPFYFQNNQ